MNEQSARDTKVSVIVPARNAVTTIGEQLDALASQTFEGSWEVIVADNGSTDDTVGKVRQWADRLPDLRIVPCGERLGKSYAVNVATRTARGTLIAYCDADDIVSTVWLASLVHALDEHVLVAGPTDLSRLNPRRLYSWRRDLGWQQPFRWRGYLTSVFGGNMAVRRETFDLVGGFDEALSSCEDYDFAFRVQLTGAAIEFVPEAVLHYRLREGWSYFRRSVDYGIGHVELYRRFRNEGLRRGTLLGVARLVAAGFGAPLVLFPKYRYGWITLAGVELGRLRGSLRTRTLFL
jgi:glycosyltransferase involved in cell wall biosynthesis